MNSFALKKTSLTFKFLLTLLVIFSSFLISTSGADAISVSSSANPGWPSKCGIKIGLLIDRSNSISDSEGTQFKTAAKGFVDALAGTSSQIAVAQFRQTATQTLGLTSVFDAAGQTTVKNTIDGYNFGTSDGAGSTNWESAFYTQQSVAADVIIILTDGNPTSRDLDGEGGNGSSDPADYNIDAGITRANELKAQGKRVVAVGIGNDVDSTNLAAVSGPTLNSDYFTSSFSSLNTKLTEIASTICGGTVTVQKQVKNANGGYDATNGWDYTATNAVVNNKTTAGNGIAEFKYENAPKTTTITETVKPGFSVESISCTKNNGQTANATVNGASVSLTVSANDIISCIYKNTQDTGTLQVKKVATGGNDTFGFTSNSALGNFNLTTVAGAAQTSVATVNTGTYDITETALAGWTLTGISCTGATPTVAGNKVTVAVAKGANVVCTYTNARQNATLTVVKNTVGGDATFGFTSNSALGNFNLTTVGGTKSTAATSVPTGTYDVTETALAGWTLTDASCTGATAVKSGSKLTITATANANIVCTYTNTRDSGTIKVVKNTVGGNGTFNFTSNITGLNNFDLTTVGNTAATAAVPVPTGTYSLAEVIPSTYSLTGLSCTGGQTSVQSPSVSITVGKGDNVVCTYTNTRNTATLTVIKNTVGGNATFNFTSNTALGDFALTTVGGTKSTVATTIPTGTYDITETATAGWSLTNLVCTGTNAPVYAGGKVTINAATSQNIVCTYTNTRDQGTVTIIKNTVGGNGTFGFTTDTSLGNFNLTTVLGTATTSTVSANTGNYNISETVPTGWTLTSKDCVATNPIFSPNGPLVSSTSNGVVINVTKGANIVCTFTNTRDTGSITVVKNTVGGNGTFSFSTNTPLGSFDLTTVGGTKSTSTVSLNTGVYNLAESVPAGWTLADLNCTGTTQSKNFPSVQITVAKGENVVCTFSNSRDTGTIQVVKNAVGGNASFSFNSNTSLGNFNLATVNGTAQTAVTATDSGSYSIAETLPVGWSLTGASCTGAQASVQGTTVNITVVKGANVVCTFTNTRDQGTIRIVKNTVNANGTFNFTSASSVGNFSLSTVGNTATTSTVNVDTGSINLAETVPAGWTLSAISCTGGSADRQGDGVQVEIVKGANVVCTFTNTRNQGSLRIVKNTLGGNGTFNFTSASTIGNFSLSTVGNTATTSTVVVDSGSYTVAETAQPGWTLTSLVCNNNNYTVNNNSVTVAVATGENVVCTYTNTRDTGKLQIKKNTVKSDGDTQFSWNSDTQLGNFTLTTASGTVSSEEFIQETGTYTITENAKIGWTLTDLVCTGGEFQVDGASVSVSVVKGANVVCTFTNTRDTAKITVVKNVVAAGGITDGSFMFSSNIDAFGEEGSFILETENGTASTETVEIPTGSYNVTEGVPVDYNLTSIACTGTEASVDGGVYLQLQKGDIVVCTFTNTPRVGKITVVKNVVEAGGVTDGTFGFTSDIDLLGDFNLTTENGTASTETLEVPVGEYAIDEIVPEGWNLNSVSCVDLNDVNDDEVELDSVGVQAASAEANVTEGSDIVCTFENERETLTIQVIENSIGGDDTFPFTLETAPVEEGEEGPVEEGSLASPEALADLATFNLQTVAGTKSTAVIVIPTGSYILSQLVPTGWTLTNLSCVGATNPIVANPKISFVGTAGQAIVCTYVDTKVPEVLGTVVTRPTDTVIPPQVLGISASNLPVTGSNTRPVITIALALFLSGALFFGATRRRKTLLRK